MQRGLRTRQYNCLARCSMATLMSVVVSFVVIELGDYATISVPTTVKRELEKMKKGKEWGEFLLDLATETKTLRGRKAFSQLSAMLSKEDLDRIQESSKDFRKSLALR